jgi:hypothetical protein
MSTLKAADAPTLGFSVVISGDDIRQQIVVAVLADQLSVSAAEELLTLDERAR